MNAWVAAAGRPWTMNEQKNRTSSKEQDRLGHHTGVLDFHRCNLLVDWVRRQSLLARFYRTVLEYNPTVTIWSKAHSPKQRCRESGNLTSQVHYISLRHGDDLPTFEDLSGIFLRRNLIGRLCNDGDSSLENCCLRNKEHLMNLLTKENPTIKEIFTDIVYCGPHGYVCTWKKLY